MLCEDMSGRRFIVEIQVMWSPEYKVLLDFNSLSGILYEDVTKTEKDHNLHLPIYSLNLLNDIFSDSDDYYHDYSTVRIAETNELIEGLRMIFIEMPKFEQESGGGKSMRVLWLRYLTEVGDSRQGIPEELEKNPEINRAMSMLLEDEFSESAACTTACDLCRQ